MDKSILEINTPKNCQECILTTMCTVDNKVVYCKGMGRLITDIKTKPEWCPLVVIEGKGETMKEIEAAITIKIKEDGETLTEINRAASIPVNTPDNEENTATGYTIYSDDDKELTEGEAERYAVASDLANVCEYLEDSEVIKIKLVIQKAQARKERAERG